MKFKNIIIRKSKNNKSWFCRFRKNKKQFYISAKTQNDCYIKLKKTLNNLEDKTLNSKLTLEQWYMQWLDLYKKDIKETTKLDYKASLKYLENIKNKEINNITTINIIETLNSINHERRKQKVYELLKDIYNKAYQNEIISKNPMLNIEKPKHKKSNGNSLTDKDENLIEKEFIKHKAYLFLVAMYQGLRKGELLALTSSDFDLKNKTLTITKSLNYKNEIDTTKNKESIRTIPLFDKTIEIIKPLLKNTNERIFNLTQKQTQNLFTKILSNIELEKKYTIHSLRHTFITKCQEKNIPLHIIQHWVGHTEGSKITNSVYTHAKKNAELLYYNIINQ